MKKQITYLIALITLPLVATGTTSAQDFTPAPTDGASASFTTTLAVGGKLQLAGESEKNDIWVDLNGNKSYDKGERLAPASEWTMFTIQEQHITIYGDLTKLNCDEQQITSLDVSKLTNLTKLYCARNLLTSLDVSKLTNLTTLYCSHNQLSGLDLSKLSKLSGLSCFDNRISSIEVNHLTNLTEFTCFQNRLNTLNVGKLTKLKLLACGENQLTSLDVEKLANLKFLYCNNNLLTSLDVGKLTNLIMLCCEVNQISSLEVSNLTELTILVCRGNRLSSLDVGKLTKLTKLDCADNQLTKLDVKPLKELTELFCFQNQIKEAKMQKIVEDLPPGGEKSIFYPYSNIKGKETVNEQNQCTPAQVKIAKDKGWKVLDFNTGKDFPGVDAIEDISASQLPIVLVAKEGVLLISGLEAGMPVVVYTIDGTSLYRGTANSSEMSIPLTAGSYVLRIANYSAKTIMP